MSISKANYNKSNLKRFNVFLFVSTFARSLIEIFISLYLFKNGFSIQSILIFYLLGNLFSLVFSYFFVRIGEKFNYSIVMFIGIVSFVILQFALNKISYSSLYLVFISLLYAIYRRGYWVARRFYITKIMPQKNSSIPYSLTIIVSEVASIFAGFLGGFLLDNSSSVNLMIISAVLLAISVLPLWRIESRGKNTKIRLFKNLKRYNKKNYLAFSLYEINNLLTFIFPIYVFLYIKDTYIMTGSMDAIGNIAIIVFVFLYGRIIKNKNYFIISSVLFILVSLTKLLFLNYLILVICFVEGIVKKMQNQSLSKIYFENRNGMDLAHYNLIYQLVESLARAIAVVPLLFVNDVKIMILIVLLIMSIELIVYALFKKQEILLNTN